MLFQLKLRAKASLSDVARSSHQKNLQKGSKGGDTAGEKNNLRATDTGIHTQLPASLLTSQNRQWVSAAGEQALPPPSQESRSAKLSLLISALPANLFSLRQFKRIL